jgi:hypothetical protein
MLDFGWTGGRHHRLGRPSDSAPQPGFKTFEALKELGDDDERLVDCHCGQHPRSISGFQSLEHSLKAAEPAQLSLIQNVNQNGAAGGSMLGGVAAPLLHCHLAQELVL